MGEVVWMHCTVILSIFTLHIVLLRNTQVQNFSSCQLTFLSTYRKFWISSIDFFLLFESLSFQLLSELHLFMYVAYVFPPSFLLLSFYSNDCCILSKCMILFWYILFNYIWFEAFQAKSMFSLQHYLWGK